MSLGSQKEPRVKLRMDSDGEVRTGNADVKMNRNGARMSVESNRRVRENFVRTRDHGLHNQNTSFQPYGGNIVISQGTLPRQMAPLVPMHAHVPPPPLPPPLPPFPPALPTNGSGHRHPLVISSGFPQESVSPLLQQSSRSSESLNVSAASSSLHYGSYAYYAVDPITRQMCLRFQPPLQPPHFPLSTKATATETSRDTLRSLQHDPLVSRVIKSANGGVQYVRGSQASQTFHERDLHHATTGKALDTQESVLVRGSANTGRSKQPRGPHAPGNHQERRIPTSNGEKERRSAETGKKNGEKITGGENVRRHHMEQSEDEITSNAKSAVSTAGEELFRRKFNEMTSTKKARWKQPDNFDGTTADSETRINNRSESVNCHESHRDTSGASPVLNVPGRLPKLDCCKPVMPPVSTNTQNIDSSETFKDSAPSTTPPLKRRRSLSDGSPHSTPASLIENGSMSYHESKHTFSNSPMLAEASSTGQESSSNRSMYVDYRNNDEKGVNFTSTNVDIHATGTATVMSKKERASASETRKGQGTSSPYASDEFSGSLECPGDHSAVSSELETCFTSDNPFVGHMLNMDRGIPAKEKPESHAPDPVVAFPDVDRDFSGIPSTSVSDLLQVWDFISNFSETLKLSPFRVRHLEQAIAYGSRCTLLDTCVTRLVHTIISDSGLASELGIPESVIRSLQSSGQRSSNGVWAVLEQLPRLLQFESEDHDADNDFLQSTVSKLNDGGREAFFTKIDAAGRLRVLRELVDYGAMADVLRECVSDSLEHIEEEKRKAREEFTSNRKRAEALIKQLRQEIIDHKAIHGLADAMSGVIGGEESASPNVDGVSNTPITNGTNPSASNEIIPGIIKGINGKCEKTGSVNTVSMASPGVAMQSRKEKLVQAAKERRQRELRQVAMRELHVLEGRLEKAKASLRTLKKSRIEVRMRDNTSGQISGVESLTDTGNNSNGDNGTKRVVRTRRTFTLEEPEDPVRTYPLGEDRHGRRYWFLDGCGRIWIEDVSSHDWCALVTIDAVQTLLEWLNLTRFNERKLHTNLSQRLQEIAHEMSSDAAFDTSERRGREYLTRASSQRAGKAGSVPSTVANFLNYRNNER